MIEIKNLTKRFGKSTALDSVSFTVGDGSIFGLVGSNGAGKSTLLRILSGVLKADGGEALVSAKMFLKIRALKKKSPSFRIFLILIPAQRSIPWRFILKTPFRIGTRVNTAGSNRCLSLIPSKKFLP